MSVATSLADGGRHAIVVERVSKQYRLGMDTGAFRYGSLRESLATMARRHVDRVWPGRSRPSPRPDFIWALSDVSLTVAAGEVVGIIGRNGAGKSTFLKILSRITKPTSGWAELRGRVGTLLEVGTGFHPELSGRDNVFLSGTILGMRRTEIQRRFDEIVAFAGIEPFLDTPVKRYSSGMYVRLAFAVAAHLDPGILLVDEVLAVGDVEFQKRCLGKMQSVVREGRTVLFVSHNMAAIKSLCARAVLFDGGRIAADGPVDFVVDQYVNRDGPLATNGHVPAEAPRVGSGEARIRQVSIEDDRGRSIGQVYFGQRFRVLLGLDVRRPVADVIVGLGLSTLDGTRIASSFSTDGGRPPLNLAIGRHRLAVDVDVTLLPRTYALDCTIVRSTGHDVDTVLRVLDFTALGVAESGPDNYRWTTVRGYIRPHTVWHAVEHVSEQPS